MPIYSSEAGDLIQQFQTALNEQSAAMKLLASGISVPGEAIDLTAVAETIEFHNDRVMTLHHKLQAFRLDSD